MGSEEPPRLGPAYRLDEPDGRLPLYRGPMRAEGDGGVLEGEGSIHFEWEPSPRFAVTFESDAPGAPTFPGRGSDESETRFVPLDLDPRGMPVPPPDSFDETQDRDRYVLTLHSELHAPGPRFGRGDAFHRMKFHIVNLGEHSGPEWVSDEHGEYRARFTVENDEWRVTVDRWPDDGDGVARLKSRGGYAFTHVAAVERPDGSAFDVGDVEALREALFLLLAFVRGAAVGLAFPTGEDADGNVVWTEWSTTLVDRWRSGFSWCHPVHAEWVGRVFPSLYRRMSDEFWGPVMTRAIRVYIAANKADPLDLAPGNAQIGLELLAWAVLVETERWIVPSDELEAHSRIRLLLKWAGIPTEPPAEVPGIAAFGRERGVDGPEAIARVRNRVVHPPRRKASWPEPDLLVDAWKLGEWYLELVILRLLDYEGEYRSRLVRGDLAVTPWTERS